MRKQVRRKYKGWTIEPRSDMEGQYWLFSPPVIYEGAVTAGTSATLREAKAAINAIDRKSQRQTLDKNGSR